jgi:hypothetical protein
MPWTVDDVERHNKGLTDKQKRQWVHVANGALEAGDDDGTAITKANGVVKKDRIEEKIEAVLRAKASAMIEAMVMKEMATLMEADPRPRVERDINGKPVVPNKAQYHQYFSDMHHEHIKGALRDARDRWSQAAKDHEAAKAAGKPKAELAHHAAHLKAIGAEISAGSNVLRLKQKKLKRKKSLATKKIKSQNKSRQGLAKFGAQAIFGKSKLATSVAKHVAGSILQKKLNKLDK